MRKKELELEIRSLKEEISCLSLDNAKLNDAIQSIETEITTFENGKYTNDVRACIYELLSLNVGVRNVAPIIHSVLRNIAHKATIIWFNVSDDSRESYCSTSTTR